MAGKRKAGEAGEGPAPVLELGDHAAYMPEQLLTLADVRIKVKGGRALPAHATHLVQHCGVLAHTPELFAGGTAAAPTVLSAPFSEYEEDEVACFLKCCYPPPAGVDGAAAAIPAVVRLAHALDAAAVLEVARVRYPSEITRLQGAVPMDRLNATAELAVTCGWEFVASAVPHVIARELVASSGPLLNDATRAGSDKLAFDGAQRVIDCCHPHVAAAVFGAVAADARRARAACLAHGLDLGPRELHTGDVRCALESRAERCIDLGGRFLLPFRDSGGLEDVVAGEFSQLGRRWKLEVGYNEDDLDGNIHICVCLSLADGPPQWVRCELGLVDLFAEGERLEAGEVEGVCSKEIAVILEVMDEGDFHALDARWLCGDRGLASVRILEVRDATAEELRAARR